METQNKENRFKTPEEEHEHIEKLVREKLAEHPERDHGEVVDEALREHIEYSIHDEHMGPIQERAKEDKTVELLVHDAMKSGILETARRVRATGNPWLFREFYIALHERYVDELRAKNFLKAA